jgi:hypothetical protein
MSKEYWTVKESIAIAAEMRKRHPDMQFDACRLCGKWCVSNLGLGEFHPTCWDKPAARKMRLADKAKAQPSLGL